jgi:hypothetical protein
MPVLRGFSSQLRGRIRGTQLLILGALALACPLAVAPASAADCVFSIAIPDRWDDMTAIPGHAGGAKSAPDWRGDDAFDQEAFTDLNGNQLWDPGEPFVDANANGRFDAEAYDPSLTGYVLDPVPGNILAPNGDLGLAITLAPAKARDAGIGRYVEFDCAGLPAASRLTLQAASSGGTGGSIDRAMRDLIALDPTAKWDAATNQVVGSAFPAGSPRVILLPVYDPRFMASASRSGPPVTKAVAAFVESMAGHGSAVVRLMRVPAPAPRADARLAATSSPPEPASWGRMRAIYR